MQRDERAGSGVGGSSDDAAAGSREAAAAGTAHLRQRVQASSVRKDCTRAAIADSLRNGPINYKWKKLGGEADPYSCMHLEEVMATKRTRRTAEWTRRNSSRLHALRVKASQVRAPRGNMARQLLQLLPKGTHEMKDNVAADGYVILSALSKKLIRKSTSELSHLRSDGES